MKRYVTLLRELLAPPPAAPVDDAPMVHRGEHEIFRGFDHLGEDRDPPGKLSREDAERLLGIPVRVIA